MIFANKIKQLREERQLLQRQLASSLGDRHANVQ